MSVCASVTKSNSQLKLNLAGDRTQGPSSTWTRALPLHYGVELGRGVRTCAKCGWMRQNFKHWATESIFFSKCSELSTDHVSDIENSTTLLYYCLILDFLYKSQTLSYRVDFFFKTFRILCWSRIWYWKQYYSVVLLSNPYFSVQKSNFELHGRFFFQNVQIIMLITNLIVIRVLLCPTTA